MRDRWRGLTSSSPAAIIHALHWASGASPFSARALPFLSLREKKSKHFLFCLVEKKNKYTPWARHKEGEEPPLVGEPSSRVAAFRWRRTLIYSTKAACRAIPRFRHWHLGGYRRGHIVPFLASFYLPPAHTCCSILGTQAETSASRSVRR